MNIISKTLDSTNDTNILVQTLVNAFEHDPAVRWMYPAREQYQMHFPEFVRAFGGAAFHLNTHLAWPDQTAVALWLPPGVQPDESALVELIERSIESERLPEVFSIFEQMAHFHPTEPHWYLPMIGVTPDAQGGGIGSALMTRALDRCDDAGLPAYLESTNPRNTPFYEHFGFRAIGRIQAPSSPPIIPMIRD